MPLITFMKKDPVSSNGCVLNEHMLIFPFYSHVKILIKYFKSGEHIQKNEKANLGHTSVLKPNPYMIWPRGYKTFLCLTQLRMKFFLLINVKILIIVGILTFMSKKISILGLSESEKS